MSGHAVYGFPPPALATVAAEAVQVSPLVPGAVDLGGLAPGDMAGLVIAAPPGALERRFVLAQALRVLPSGGELVALAPKDKGGARLRGELEAFGCTVNESARRHHRICRTLAPAVPAGLDEALARGALQFVPKLGLWSQPGVFSWDRVDPGSALLLETATDFAGAGADLGCGLGALAMAALASQGVSALTLLDVDARAIAAARRNIDDARAAFLHADVRGASLTDLDFVITNPPFHDGGREDRGLGQAFIAAAARMLRSGGVCRLVANISLPYEQPLIAHFRQVSLVAQARGYKVYEARK